MTGEHKLSADAFLAQSWRAGRCQITGCRSHSVSGGMRCTLNGVVTLVGGACRIRFRWRTSQIVSGERASAPIVVEQEYMSLPTISGVLLVDDAGQTMPHEDQLRLMTSLMNKTKGEWEAKVRHVARLFY